MSIIDQWPLTKDLKIPKIERALLSINLKFIFFDGSVRIVLVESMCELSEDYILNKINANMSGWVHGVRENENYRFLQ